MSTFSKLRKNRGSQIANLVAAAEKTSGEKKSFGDDRFWQPTVDKAGNSFSVIRFLPAGNDEDLPWAVYYSHGFKGATGQWYIENSLTSVGQDDPVSESNSILWNSGDDEDKVLARDRKRRKHHVSNILVVNDPDVPENNGKVFLYRYGKKIHDKIMDLMQPGGLDPDEKPINPFDLWEGANFKLKIRKFEGYRNYDKSEFASPGAVSEDDKVLEATCEELHGLGEWTDATSKQYKTYDELKAKFMKVTGEGISNTLPSSPAPAAPSAQSEAAPWSDDTASASEPDANIDYFQSLANE